MRGVLMACLEDAGALDRFRIREGRIRCGAFKRGILTEVALWAMVFWFFWSPERCE